MQMQTRFAYPLSISQANNLVAGHHPVGIFREQRGLTVEELSRRSGVSADEIEAMEQGRVKGSVSAREKLALALSVPVRDLAWSVERLSFGH